MGSVMNLGSAESKSATVPARRILLVSTNRCAAPDVVFPLGLCHVAAALQRAGHNTRLIDLNVEAGQLEGILAEFRPEIVGFSVRNIDDVLIRKRETFLGELRELCAAVRRHSPCPIVLGGSGFSIFPENLLEWTAADYGIQGEGERAFVELIETLWKGGDLSSIGGLVWRSPGRGIIVAPRPPAYPPASAFVARPVALSEYYLSKTGMLNLLTQRGCAEDCCYCTYPVIEGRSVRARPPETVADEMAAMEALGAKYVFVVDSVFNSSIRHVREVCEALIRRQLKMRWGCFLRPRNLTRDLMELMARAGLAHIEFGSDSFCDSILDAYEKHFTFEEIRRSSEIANACGIDYCHFLICGGPGETAETLQLSYENSLSLRGAVIMATVGMRIYPGTALHRRALSDGLLTAGTDLLSPAYYVAPGLDVEAIFEMLRGFSKRSPNWIPGDPQPGYTRFVERLRSRGVVGPLWSYFCMMQRLWPQPAEASL